MSSSYIFLVQEPYLYNTKLSLKPRTCSTFTGSTEHARTVIYASKNLNIWPLAHLSHRDCTAVTTVINNRTTIIASIYLDYHLEVLQPWLEALMEYRRHKGYAILLGIDSNSHSQLYGEETNTRGKAIEDFIANHRLNVHNICLLYTSPSPRD